MGEDEVIGGIRVEEGAGGGVEVERVIGPAVVLAGRVVERVVRGEGHHDIALVAEGLVAEESEIVVGLLVGGDVGNVDGERTAQEWSAAECDGGLSLALSLVEVVVKVCFEDESLG